jgi:uncharacterized protein YdhG (YjbR/CyaY superfamily)
MIRAQANTIDEYLAGFPEEVQQLLSEVREAIRKAAPGAQECIKYAIPTFTMKKNLVHFGGFKHHIGFYPTAAGIAQFNKELEGYKTSKGAVQFPISEPLPLKLIEKIVRFRVKQVQGSVARK